MMKFGFINGNEFKQENADLEQKMTEITQSYESLKDENILQ